MYANESLCKELYQLSEWYEQDDYMFLDHPHYYDKRRDFIAPKYSLGYLMRKLPPVIQDPYDKKFKHIQMWINGDGTAHIGYVEPYAHDDKVAYAQSSDEIEDVAAKLAIELFKQGILTKEENDRV